MAFDLAGFNREVGLRLQLHRKRLGKKQEEIARMIGVPRATYANVEGGRQRISLDLAWKAAIVFGVTVDALVPQRKSGSGRRAGLGDESLARTTALPISLPEPE